MQKITPHLWFNNESVEAAKYYVDVFGRNSKVTNIAELKNTPSGNVDTVSFNLWGYNFMAMSAGPLFKFNPSISFMVNFDPSQNKNATENLDSIWNKLIKDGKALMPLEKYPFSDRYGWVQDKYGVSWQLILTSPEGEERPLIIPSLLFTKEVYGKAEEASDFYISVFKNSKRGAIEYYPKGMEPDREGTTMFTDFMLEGQWFAAMDSAREHEFTFNEAISFMVSCKNQQEIDYYWQKLSAVPKSEQCGWLKDKYGFSWQIVPQIMDQMMAEGTPQQIEQVTQAFLKMKKFNISELEKAYLSKGDEQK
jgi:predicted 3-demethylubiquinone-9 3-methyltransferase (glyoxalase superfamily)